MQMIHRDTADTTLLLKVYLFIRLFFFIFIFGRNIYKCYKFLELFSSLAIPRYGWTLFMVS